MSNLFKCEECDTKMIAFIPYIEIETDVLFGPLKDELDKIIDKYPSNAATAAPGIAHYVIIDIFDDCAKILSSSTDTGISSNQNLFKSSSFVINEHWDDIKKDVQDQKNTEPTKFNFQYGYTIGDESGPILRYDSVFGPGGDMEKLSNSLKDYEAEMHRISKDIIDSLDKNDVNHGYYRHCIEDYFKKKTSLLNTMFINYNYLTKTWESSVEFAQKEKNSKQKKVDDLTAEKGNYNASLTAKRDELSAIKNNSYLYGG